VWLETRIDGFATVVQNASVEPDRTEFIWSCQPADFFEGPYERMDGDALLRVDAGRAVVAVSGREPGVSSFAITGGKLDVVPTDASGKVAIDTKAERLNLKRQDLDDLSAKAQAEPVLGRMLERYSTPQRS
jgi:hypothetical protein